MTLRATLVYPGVEAEAESGGVQRLPECDLRGSVGLDATCEMSTCVG
jgi:hypothetical protein